MQLKLKSPQQASMRLKRRRALLPLAFIGVPIVLFLGHYQWRVWTEPADAILVLGGSLERETFAAQFAREHATLPLWVSSGSNPEYAEWLYGEAGIPADRYHLDYRASDTVTNFTTLVEDLKGNGVDKVYLVTSSYHMRRARLIGDIVLGAHGIAVEPIVVESNLPEESLSKALRDGARALVWLATGYSGADLKDDAKSMGQKLRQGPLSPALRPSLKPDS
jgi:uncharacterized SAM-binding protein YcdF (DUF218 family)